MYGKPVKGLCSSRSICAQACDLILFNDLMNPFPLPFDLMEPNFPSLWSHKPRSPPYFSHGTYLFPLPDWIYFPSQLISRNLHPLLIDLMELIFPLSIDLIEPIYPSQSIYDIIEPIFLPHWSQRAPSSSPLISLNILPPSLHWSHGAHFPSALIPIGQMDLTCP